MQNNQNENNTQFNNHPGWSQNPNLIQQGGGGLPGQSLNQPIGPQQPVIPQQPQQQYKVEQGQTFERPSKNLTKRTLRPQTTRPQLQTTRPVSKPNKRPTTQVDENDTETVIKQFQKEFLNYSKKVNNPGILNRMEELLTKILNLRG